MLLKDAEKTTKHEKDRKQKNNKITGMRDRKSCLLLQLVLVRLRR